MLRLNYWLSLLCSCIMIAACKKVSTEITTYDGDGFTLSYGDSIIYLQNLSGDHILTPAQSRTGVYYAYPEGLQIDKNTGAINVSKSETGLRYKIKFRDAEGVKYETKLLLSGVNYADHYHQLAQNDNLSVPLYNVNHTLPQAAFDVDGSARAQGLAIDPLTGVIDLKQSVQNGFFGRTPDNDARRMVEIKYRINDASNDAVNSIKVLLYWYATMNDVSEEVKQTIASRQQLFGKESVQDVEVSTSNYQLASKPRPPCVIVISQ